MDANNIIFSKTPISLNQFNSLLSTCHNSKDVKNRLGFLGSNVVNCIVFLNSAEPLIRSYPDVTPDSWNVFMAKIKELFPNKKDSSAISELDQKIKIKGLMSLGKLSSNVDKAREKDLNEAQEMIKIDFWDRFDQTKKLRKGFSDKNSAEVIQMILNLIVFENDLFNALLPVLELYFREENLIARQESGVSRSLLLPKGSKVYLFEIPSRFVPEIDKYLKKLSSYIDFYQEDKRTYVALKPVIQPKDFPKLRDGINELLVFSDEYGVFPFLKSALASVDRLEFKKNESNWDESKEYQDLMKIHKGIKNFIVDDVDKSYCSSVSTPFLGDTLVELQNLDRSNQDKVKALMIHLQKAYKLREANLLAQKELYNFSANSLNNLIQNNLNDKDAFAFYTRDLRKRDQLVSPFPEFSNPWEENLKPAMNAEAVGWEKNMAIEAFEAAQKSIPFRSQTKKKNFEKKERRFESAPSSEKNPEVIIEPVKESPKSLPKEKAAPKSSLITKESKPQVQKTLTHPSLLKQNPGIRSSFIYDPRVKRWFDVDFNEDRGLPENKFPEYQLTSIPHQKLQYNYHAFSRFVDNFLFLGIQTIGENSKGVKGPVFVLPGELNNEKGAFIYAYDGQTLFHRYFTTRPDEELGTAIVSAFYEHQFPSLSLQGTRVISLSRDIELNSQTIQYRYDNQGNVMLRDGKNSIKLLNTHENDSD